jgi:hypothetical protein
MHVEPEDLAPDYDHLMIAVLKKQAEVEWKALSKDFGYSG